MCHSAVAMGSMWVCVSKRKGKATFPSGVQAAKQLVVSPKPVEVVLAEGLSLTNYWVKPSEVE